MNSRDKDGCTPLHIAAMQENGHYMMRILVTRKDINVNATDNSGRTPLPYAAANNNILSLTMLLECNDIDVNLQDTNNESPLHFAVWSRDRYRAVKKILDDPRTLPNKESSNGDFPLSTVALINDMNLLNVFMTEERTDINFDCQSHGGRSPLQITLYYEHGNFAIQLLQVPGLSLNCVYSFRMTPLILAVYLRGLGFMRCLLRYPGIEFNHQDEFGKTAVMTAAQLKNIGALELLLAKEEIDVNCRCIFGQTMLDYARSCDDPEVTSIIKASGRFKGL